MVLPMILFRVPDPILAPLMESIRTACALEEVYPRVELTTDQYQSAVRGISCLSGTVLMVTCVDEPQTAAGREALQLGRLAVEKNRDHYVIYVAKDNRTMIQIAPYCVMPTAIVTQAILCHHSQRLMKQVCLDYKRIYKADEEENFISVKEKSSVRRVNTSQICAVTSSAKMAEIHTLKETIVTNDTLENISKKLGEGFARCHRSTIVNTARIERVDFQEMSIVLMNGMEVPLARSFKQALHGILDKKREDES